MEDHGSHEGYDPDEVTSVLLPPNVFAFALGIPAQALGTALYFQSLKLLSASDMMAWGVFFSTSQCASVSW